MMARRARGDLGVSDLAGHHLVDREDRAAGAPPAEAAGCVLGPMDTISIRIVNERDLDATMRVEPDGTINFPYVGRIKAAGLTEDELARVQSASDQAKSLGGPETGREVMPSGNEQAGTSIEDAPSATS